MNTVRSAILLLVLLGVAMAQPANVVPALYNGMVFLRSSQDYNAEHGVANSVMNRVPGQGAGCWAPYSMNTNQWIMASSITPFGVKGIAIQGRYDYDQWVTSFQIHYSLDGINWTQMYNGGSTTFYGNSDRNTPVYINFPSTITVRNILIKPLTWYGGIALRWEVFIPFF
ncbi:hypothetical protein SAMD00019534_013150 [Acytostelium subglobosum LB1]|uniref:hypothetical protein n=1 Tax=Acytostelium subglobosum LB1 TaxID=1410327 RepID=UPI0006449AB5|nr:hypothetical protein SAMD00019534_013150 [Acytostelium subglobosum LB1]GAM18140.1 hypothetical protein SAMD00019534_013150 [Acytostelium subglobosum LB1]|eukprot:XP_012758736.1 hypothetical protein SAMD00019534_013150 [Acytostelium subglobosum LB1]